LFIISILYIYYLPINHQCQVRKSERRGNGNSSFLLLSLEK
jgi:hypothetical protein